jgi:hypothetical protein
LEDWREGIRAFDIDLLKRMRVIHRHEVTGINLDDKVFVLRILGFVMRGQFPKWRDHTKEWRNRNRDRVNGLARIQQKNYRLKNGDRVRKREREYYKKRRAAGWKKGRKTALMMDLSSPNRATRPAPNRVSGPPKASHSPVRLPPEGTCRGPARFVIINEGVSLSGVA